MKIILRTAAGIFAVIPGIGVLQSGLGVPPGVGNKLIFGGIIEAFGVLSLLLLAINHVWVCGLSKRTVTIATVVIAGLAFVLLLGYIGCYQYCVVTSAGRGTVYLPIWTTGGLAEMVSAAGGRAAAIDMYGRYAVYEAVNRMGEFPRIATGAVLLMLYTGFFTSLTCAFGFPAAHQEAAKLAARQE